MYRYSKSMVTLPDFRVIGPSENQSDMAVSPDFYSFEIRGDRFTDFCVHTARFTLPVGPQHMGSKLRFCTPFEIRYLTV